MRAIVRQHYGGPEQLAIQELPVPEPARGHVCIEIKGFGLNHAETYMRKGEWGEVANVSGIECVGLVREDLEGQFAAGQKVAANGRDGADDQRQLRRIHPGPGDQCRAL